MKKLIAYTLNSNDRLGCLPECVVLNIDENGGLNSAFQKITKKNIANYQSELDETDKQLINCCWQLEKDTIISKIDNKTNNSWNSFTERYFNLTRSDAKTLYYRKYITDYVNSYQNRFFDLVGERRLYLPDGKFPFMWKRLEWDVDMPELNYRFTYIARKLSYSLAFANDSTKLDIRNSILVSRIPARIIHKNRILEFNNEVDGARLMPFFKKDIVEIPASKTEDYLRTFVTPLIAKQQVIAEGFTIQTQNDLPNVVLRVKELKTIQQLSLFGEPNSENSTPSNLVFELLFEYNNFDFWAGKNGATVSMDLTDKYLRFKTVERDVEFETEIISAIANLGCDLNGKVQKLSYYDAIEWLSKNTQQLELLVVEIRFDKNLKKRADFFVGATNISITITEERDWFDVKGIVTFGNITIPFIQILKLIRRNKPEIILPNGEIALIPKAWFEEYKSLSEHCKFDEKTVSVAKHFCMLTQQLDRQENVKLSFNDNMIRFIESNVNVNYELPSEFKGQLRTYQYQGYNWLRQLDELSLGGCLADDMGLGKTVQTLCFLQWMKEQNRTISLLIVPTSLLTNWQREANIFAPKLKVYIHSGLNRIKSSEIFDGVDLFITTYAILRRDIDFLKETSFNYVILDEAQAIKNPTSMVAKACLELNATNFLTLTGTPLENAITDLWMQMHFTNRHMLGSSNHFTRQCKEPKKLELYRTLIKPFLLRRLKSNVLKDLPEKTIIVQQCEMNDDQLDFYRQTKNKYVSQILDATADKENPAAFLILEGLLRMRQAANHPVMVDKTYQQSSGKFEMVCSMLSEVAHEGNKVLVFSSFVEHLNLYKQYLENQNINFCYIDGSTKDRQKQVDLFQNSDDYCVFLLSLKAGGVGLNLTRAGYVFLLDPWWNPAAEAQAYDRAHRIGQKNKVFVYKFISSNTIEEKIIKLQEEKMALFDTMVNSEADVLKKLTLKEIKDLLN